MALIYGVLAAFLALTIQGIVWIFHPTLFTLQTPLQTGMIFSLLFLAFSEEFSRTVFVNQYQKNTPGFNFFPAALLFGIGFAGLETLLAYWSGFSWAILGAASFHILVTFFTFWWLKESREQTGFSFLILLLTAVHFCFNLSLLTFFS